MEKIIWNQNEETIICDSLKELREFLKENYNLKIKNKSGSSKIINKTIFNIYKTRNKWELSIIRN